LHPYDRVAVEVLGDDRLAVAEHGLPQAAAPSAYK
jgi:hypothetical protein